MDSKDEVSRQSSPDGAVDAILYEINGAATTSFGYEVEVREKGKSRGVIVANLDGAVRNATAYGVNLRWMNDRELVVEYLSARFEALSKPRVDVAGREVSTSLRKGIEDSSAPGGGMLYNLHSRAHR
jgi:hypothetical protein